MAVSRERKAELNREYRRRRAVSEGRTPGRTGRPRKTLPKPEPWELPALHTGHPLFDEARAATGIAKDERSWSTARVDRLVLEDGLSEAVLAIIEKRDPKIAYARYRLIELAWINKTGPFLGQDED